MKRAVLWWMGVLFAATAGAETERVPRFARHEVAFTATGQYGNPYVELAAEATLTEPDGRGARTVPLFWAGGAAWKFRFAPDQVGTWRWTVKSADAGLDGKTGSFVCVASELRGSIMPRPKASRHFQYQNGEPLWFMGDTAWAYVTDNGAEKHDRAAAERYVRNRAAQGFNVIHLMLLNEAGWGNSGGPPWRDIGRQELNPAYFAEADERIGFANRQGVVTGIAVAWGDKGRNEPYAWNRFPDRAARERFARYVAARYAAYDVYFIVSGEWHGEVRSRGAPAEAVRAEFVALGDVLRAADPHRRMIAIHPMTEHGSTREFNAAARWMDFADYQQNYRELHARALAAREVAKPVVNSEYGYYLRDQNGDGQVDKPHSYTVDDLRHATWDIAMAGAYFVTGFGSTYMGGHRHPTTFLPDDPQNTIWAAQIGHVRQFFTGLDYTRLEPHDELVTCPTPRAADRAGRIEVGDRHVATTRAPAVAYWCLAEPGEAYVVYVRGTKEPLTISVTRGNHWEATRFDPRTGRPEVSRWAHIKDRLMLRPPDEQDWLFVVRPSAP